MPPASETGTQRRAEGCRQRQDETDPGELREQGGYVVAIASRPMAVVARRFQLRPLLHPGVTWNQLLFCTSENTHFG